MIAGLMNGFLFTLKDRQCICKCRWTKFCGNKVDTLKTVRALFG